MRRLANGRECEQCQIAQASTVRETETATGLIYYWRKTEIKCSATACETYGVLALCQQLLSCLSFSMVFHFFSSFFFFFFFFFFPDKQQPFSPPHRVVFGFFPLFDLHFAHISPTRVIDCAILSSASAIVQRRDRVESRRNESSLLVLLIAPLRSLAFARLYKYLRQTKMQFGESQRTKIQYARESSKATARVSSPRLIKKRIHATSTGVKTGMYGREVWL